MATVGNEAPESALSGQLSIINESPSRIPGPSYLHELVSQDALGGASPALDFLAANGARTDISYRELHDASTSLSQKLLDTFPGSLDDQEQFVVPLLLPQSPELYIAQLAILKAGGAFCPLNLDAPPERVKFIIGDVSAKILITNSDLASKIPTETGVVLILVDEPCSSNVVNGANPSKGPRKQTPEDLAYVMYTSGSTGTPKGVGISHDAATQSLLAHDRHIPKFMKFLQFAAPTFDVSVFEIFFPLFRGRTLVCCDRSEMLNDLPAVLRKMKVDACELTPTVAGSLLRTRANAPGLRLLLTIGEMLTEPVIKEFGGDGEKSSILWAMYGPTEAAIHCTLQTAFSTSSVIGNIGFPLDTVSSFVVNPLQDGETATEFKVLPLGEIGELAVGGYQLASGYINRPEQTAAAFIQTRYGRLYRTGDKARILPNGRIECLGRISDGQVKLRGQRIELGEIEQAAFRTSGCLGAVAAVIQGILVLFCEVDNEKDMGGKIIETCKAWLPAFMVPNDVVLLRDFPRLASGKVDRKSLKSQYSDSTSADTDVVDQPSDEVERKLVELAQEVLQVTLKRTSVLATSGMDSITAIKYASLLRHSGFEVNAVDVLNSKTVSNLRKVIEQRQEVTGEQDETNSTNEKFPRMEVSIDGVLAFVPALRAHKNSIETVFPCTPVQESMLAETSANPTAYCNWSELEFPRICKPEQVMSWFHTIANSNESLRTGFALVKNHFAQIIWKELDESQIRRVKRADNRFEIGDQKGFLRPFDVQISVTPKGRVRTLIRLHHAIYDGWSFDLILSDLDRLARGEGLLDRPQFRVISHFYQSGIYVHESNLARTFWAEQLQGFQPKPMPQLLAKTTNDQIFSASRTVDINPADLETLSRKLDCSVQIFFQACLVWLWGAILGNDDVVIGTVTSGRTISIQDIENVVGPCINTIPLRTKLNQVRTIRELLEGIHATNRESLAYCTLPLMEIKKAAAIPAGKPLYDALFVFQESIHSRNRTKSIVRQLSHQDYLETKLLMEVEPLTNSYEFRITYHLSVFHYAHVQLMLGQLQALLKFFVANPDAKIESIPSCFTGNLVSQYNTKPKRLEGVADIAELVQATVSTCPQKPAVCFAKSISGNGMNAEIMSYHELNTLANRIGRHLRRNGAKEGDVVAIIMEKSIALYAGILGILKAGCAYLPLLPTTPSERITTILAQGDVNLSIMDSNTRDTLYNKIPGQILDIQDAELQRYDDSNLDIPPNPQRNANIIYTSGSTGVPKGVCVTQLNISSNLDVLSRIYPVKEGSRLLQSCSQAFDVSVFEIFFAWSRGMCLCSATNDTLFEDLELSIRSLEVTHLSMTPTVASLITPSNVPKVGFLVTSGEPMTEEVARKWTGKLYQGYGPSETTNICSVKKMVSGDAIRHLGCAFENTSAFVLARGSMDVMPVGCVGELCFGGDQVTAGYLKLPDLTSQNFINHPRFGRLYRSGDMGRMLADGSLLIIGRVDDQVKLRGQRIELGEINAVVSSLEEIRGCVTLLDADNQRGSQLVTFYVPRSRADKVFKVISVQDRLSRLNSSLYGLLRSKVPMYMVPSHLVPVSTIPTTSSGKVDKDKFRAAFRALGHDYLESSAAPVEEAHSSSDWSNDERTIAEIVAQSLQVSQRSIGRWTPFTSLGLDSISAISLAKKLQKSLHRRTPVSAVLQNPCVARLAKALATQNPDTAIVSRSIDNIFSSSFVEDVKRGFESRKLAVQKVLPCTPLQEAMLSSSTDNSYVNSTLFRLKEKPEKLRNAWMMMCQRHEILRTCFVSTESAHHPVAQVILQYWDPPWLSLDAKGSSVQRFIDRHVETMSEALGSYTPPVSFAIIQESSELFLSFVCHHALYDGVAVTRLFFEIEQLIHGATLPHPPASEPFLQGMVSLPESSEEFWMNKLQEYEPKPLPHVCGLARQIGKKTLDKRLDISNSSVNDQLKELNVSLLSVAEACWGALLTILLGSDDVCFGNVMSGRSVDVDRIDELVAPCFNTIPIRLRASSARRSIDVVKYFQKLNPELLQYQFTPLRRIQKLFSKDGTRLFDTLLLLQQPPRELDDEIWSLERDDGVMDFTLVCELTPLPAEDNIEVKLHYDRSSVSDDFALLIYDTLANVFANFLAFPSSRLPALETLPDVLRKRFKSMNLVRQQSHTISSLEDTTDAVSSHEETVIRSVFSELSQVSEERIRGGTTIYRLGMDSINAVQIAAMLRRQGLQATATDVIEHPTCAKLAACLVKKRPQEAPIPSYDLIKFEDEVKSTLESSNLELDKIGAILPCTPLQAGLLMEFLNSNGENYFNFITLEMNEGISLPVLRQAWSEVVENNAMFRTGFIPVDHRDTSFAMVQYNYLSRSAPLSIISKEQRGGFNLTKWQSDARNTALSSLHDPPWRAALVETQDNIITHLAVHHALYDAQSLHNVFQDLTRLLRNTPMIDRPGPQDAVEDIMAQLQARKDEKRSFWEGQSGRAIINNFPIMTPLRRDKGSICTESQTCDISQPSLQNAAKVSGFTIQAIVQAAWSRILSSYLGEPSVMFGVVLSGRNSEATRDTSLPCVTTLPVMSENVSDNKKLLDSMMEFNTKLHEHQHTPLTAIQRWLGHPNSRLFDTILVYQKLEGDSEQRLPWKVLEDRATADYPLSIEVEPQGDQVELRITFHDNILPSEQAKRLLSQFNAVLCELAQRPEGRDEDVLETHPELFSITPAEHNELPSGVLFLHEFVETSARQSPDKTALQFITAFDGERPIDKSWTYRELNVNGNKVANILAPHVETGDIVAIDFDKCPEAHFAILGILKAGCSFVALDPTAPPSRKEFIVRDSGASVLVTDIERSQKLDFNISVPIIGLDENVIARAPSDKPKLSRPLTPSDRSYCLYTSGTTGTPKGCELTHRNAVQAMLAFRQLFEEHWDPDSKWLQFASYHFDVSVLEQFWTWSVGVVLVAAPRDVILEDLTGIISRLDITHIDLTPSLARLLHPDDVPSLCRGVFITGGEQLKQEILDVWGDKGAIHNFYGPTEATIGVTTFPQVPRNGRSSNIGKQFANVGSFVLRPNTDVPVLRGGVGELCVSGPLVGKGYLNREDLTAERFPTLKGFNERVYRTGDLVRVLHDGCFDFLGRSDDQVKLRGQRLEIGEINHCIRSGVPEVTDVATVVVRNEEQQKDLLVSFVVTNSTQKVKKENSATGIEAKPSPLGRRVQEACRSKLPGYMVPTYILELSRIPLSPNNKAEIKELKRIFNELSSEQLLQPSSNSTADFGVAGKKIVKVLGDMELVDTEELSVSTNIFELGIDSISVLRFVRALKREGFTKVTPALVMKNPIIKDLLQALEEAPDYAALSTTLESRQILDACQHRHRAFVCKVLRVRPESIEYLAPCSALQQGMISRSRSDENKGAYFNTFHFDLEESVVPSRLQAAWRKLVDHNAILRTKFVSTTEGFVQVAMREFQPSWNDLSLEQGDSVEKLLVRQHQRWVDNNAQNIESPLEFLLIDTGVKKILILHMFHGIYDANSFELMLESVVGYYNDEGRDSSAPTFLEALLHGPLMNYNSSRGFWETHMDGAAPVPFQSLIDFPSKTDISITRMVSFRPFEKLRKCLGVTHQALIQALWASILQSYTASGSVIGVIIAGRSIELENVDCTIGPLFNTVPYHHRLNGTESWSSTIRGCHDFNTAVLQFQHVPLRDIQKWCLGGKPLFDTLFSFQNRVSQPNSGKKLWTEVDSDMNPDYPLALEATLLPDDKLQLVLVAQKGIADEGSLNTLLKKLEAAAREAADNPDGPVSYSTPVRQLPNGPSRSYDSQTAGDPSRQRIAPSSEFTWTSQARTLQREIGALANVEAGSINEGTGLLELGLDSIDTIKLSAKLKRQGIPLTNSQLIKSQNIQNLVKIIGDSKLESTTIADSSMLTELSSSLKAYICDSAIELGNMEDVLPPTPLQDAMVSEMIQSDFQRYFNHDVLELSPKINFARLRKAWAKVISHSPILRTVFVQIDNPAFDFGYCQLVLKDSQCHMQEVELRDSTELQNMVEEARKRALRGAGLSGLLQLTFAGSQDKKYLVLSIAHALYDGWSLALLHQDVRSAYTGTYSPRDHGINYMNHIIQSTTPRASAFWADYLSGAKSTQVAQRQDVDMTRIVHRAEVKSSASATVVKNFCKRHGVSVQTVAQATWAAMLATRCRTLDVTFGVVLSGRETESAEELMFPTMNTVPIRSVLHGTVASLLRYMQENMLSVNEFQHFPLRKIRTSIANRSAGLFNTLFILQKGLSSPSSESEELVVRSVGGSSAIEYPVCGEMEIVDDYIIWRTACEDSYLTEAETNQLIDQLDAVLAFFMQSPEADTLAATQDGISVCGLPPFQPQTPESQNSPRQTQKAGDDENSTWSEVEGTLRSVLADLSGVELSSIRKDYSIYHLGLDSISAIKASSLLRKKGVTIGVRDLLRATSIVEMEEIASQAHAEPQSPHDVDEPVNMDLQALDIPALLRSAHLGEEMVAVILPATAMQVHMLSVWQNSNGAVFFPNFTYKLSGVRSRDSIEAAWHALLESEPILRTCFISTGGKQAVPFVQVVLKEFSETHNLVSLQILDEGSGQWILSLMIHHALYDGVSLPIILDRFTALLADGKARHPERDTAALQSWKGFVSKSVSEKARVNREQFWRAYLQGAAATKFAYDGTTTSQAKRTISRRVERLQRKALSDVASLRAASSKLGLSIQSLFLAAYAKALGSKFSGAKQRNEVVFGIYLANRGADDDISRLSYPTLGLVPLRVKLSSQSRLHEIARQVQSDLQEISSAVAASVGLWEIQEWTGVVLDSFVNFLALPGEVDPRQRQGDVQLREVTEPSDEYKRPGKEVDPRHMPWLSNNSVQNAYPDAVDVEVAVTSDGAMDIGVFGPEDKLGAQGSRELIAEIVETLRRV